MTPEELASLNARFQAAYRVFDDALKSKITLSLAQAMDQSPVMLSLLEQQLAKADPDNAGIGSIRLGESGNGTVNTQYFIITIDPNDFDALANNPGSMALRFAHEIGHTIDPQPPVVMTDFTDPMSYHYARSRSEGFALQTEATVLTDWKGLPGGNPYTDARLTFEAPSSRALETAFDQIRVDGLADGRTAEQIADAQVSYAALENSRSTPSNENDGATYLQQDVRDFVLNALGVTSPQARKAFPPSAFDMPVTEDAASGFWSAKFVLPDGDGGNRTFTRTAMGELLEEGFDRNGVLLDTKTTANGRFQVATEAGADGATVFKISSPAGALLGSATEYADDSQAFLLFAADGEVLQSTQVQQAGDGSSTLSTTYADGATLISNVAADGRVTMTVEREIGGHRVKVAFVEDEWGEMQADRVLSVDGQVPADAEAFAAALDGQGYTPWSYAAGSAGSDAAALETMFANNDPMRPSGVQTLTNLLTSGTLIDALSLLRALQTGEPLPVLASGLRLANDLSNPSSMASLELSGAANVASGVLSLLSLEAALQRGDTLAAVTAGAQALSFGATAFASFAAEQTLLATTVEEAVSTQLAYNAAQEFAILIESSGGQVSLIVTRVEDHDAIKANCDLIDAASEQLNFCERIAA